MIGAHRHRCVIGLLVLLGSAYIYSLSPRYRTTCQADKQVTAISRRVVEEIEPLCRILAPEQNTLLFAVVPGSIRANPLATVWIADCANNRKEDILHIVWDENHRRLMSISRLKEEHCGPHRPITDAAQAEAIARNWLTKISSVTGQDVSSASCQARQNYATWAVKVQTPDCRAIVWLNSRSSVLLQVIISYSDASYSSIGANQPEQCHKSHH